MRSGRRNRQNRRDTDWLPARSWEALLLVGIDIVENDRFAAALERRPRMMERLFTRLERDYCLSKANPARHFAARFAAKEAVGKALGTGIISFQEIEIGCGGRPGVNVSGSTRAAVERLSAERLCISLSHSDTVSVAVAIADGGACQPPERGGPVQPR